MKCIRFFLVVILGCCFNYSQAQISMFINGKEMKSGATVNKSDLASLEVSFKNPKSPTVVIGKTVLLVQINDAKNREIEEWFIVKEGYSAFTDFLKNTPAKKKFKVFGSTDFRQYGNDLNWLLSSSPGRNDRKTVQVSIKLFFREEIGYKEYGEAVSLLEPAVLNIPLWDTKSMFLPYLDLTIDKTNIASDMDLKQNGRLGEKGTELGYVLQDKNNFKYSIYALDAADYPGMNAKELADDFIHAAALYAAQDYVTKFKDYDIEKYTLPWDDINGLLSDRRRLPNLSWKVNKDIKKMDLMTLYQPVEINSMKGYVYKSDVQFRMDKTSKWQDLGKFVIYIVSHPTNENLTLVASTIIHNDAKTTEELDSFLKVLLNSIRK